MKNIAFIVEGMTSDNCVNSIKQNLRKINGVNDIEVSLEKMAVDVNYEPDKVSIDEMKDTIKKTGYNVI